MRKKLIGLHSFLAISAAASSAWAAPFVSDLSLAGTPFNPGVRGQAIPSVTIDRGDFITGMPKALAVSDGSSLRGVAGGLEADTYNWKNRNNSAREGTLNYLRYSRDRKADLYITANIRGLVEPDPNSPGDQRFYDTSISTLATLAGDWVRYTNRIAQIYRQGDTVTDVRDKAILDSLVWSSSTAGDNFDKLLAVGEAAVPKVKYWEIGNEPRVGLSSYRVTNTYTFIAPPSPPTEVRKTDFRERYAALTSAMLAEDPTIKVGPAIQWLSSASEQAVLNTILQPQADGSFLPIDFLGYHPYQKLNTFTTAPEIEGGLRGIYDDHAAKITSIRNQIAAAGRDPYSIAFVASEQNASNWSSNDTPWEANMAHALGSVETVFSFARLGVQAAHYWVWPAHRWDGTEYPSYRAFQKLRDHMGDTLVSVSADNLDNLHLYTTRDSKTGERALWALNFSDSMNTTRSTPLLNVGGRGKVTLYTLGALSGATSLFSSNLASDMAGGPSNTVDWKTVDLTGQRLDNLNLTFGSATITLLTIDKWKQMSLPGDVNVDGKVNSTDAGIITAAMNTDEKNWWQGDVNGDGLVNAADSAIVTGNNGVVTGTKWNVQAGTWTTGSNWVGNSAPNAIGANAYLGSTITAARSLTTTSALTLGTLIYDNVNTYDLIGSGSLKFQSSGSTSSRLYVINGNQKITVPLTLASSTIMDIAADMSLTVGNLTINSSKTLAKNGGGTLTVNGTQSHATGTAMFIDGGTLNLNSNAGSTTVANLTLNANAIVNIGAKQNLAAMNVGAKGVTTINANGATVVTSKTLTVATGGKLDVTNNRMVVTDGIKGSWSGGKYTDMTGLIQSGKNGGLWNGTGIVTSMLDAKNLLTTIGIADADESGFAGKTFGGQSVATGDVLVMYTYLGDANLDGAVNADDYALIDTFSQVAGASGYYRGDFNYDGSINADDYALIDLNIQRVGSVAAVGATAPASLVAVPEPAAAMLAIGLIPLLRRRRKCKH
jgi:hypothetical protein